MVRTAVLVARFAALARPVWGANVFRTAVLGIRQISVSSTDRIPARIHTVQMHRIAVLVIMRVQITLRPTRPRIHVKMAFVSIPATAVIRIAVA